MKKFWNFVKNEETAETELLFNGPISEDTWFGDEVTPALFRDELSKVKGDLTVWLNSPGGDVFAASQIYTMLRNHKGKVTVKINALAASAASVVAMAGDETLIAPTAMLMIHDPACYAAGNKADMEKAIELLEALEENVFRPLATRIQTAHGDRKIPVITQKGEACWMEEEEAYTLSDDAFGQIALSAYKVGTAIKISEELLNDSVFDLPSYIAKEFARRIGTKEEEAFLIGDGKGKPTGIFAATGGAENGATTASAAITFDDMIELFYSLKSPYRKKAVWVLNEQTVKALRKVKDSNGQYIWQPSVTAGVLDTILNRPYVTSVYAPTPDAGSKAIAFGDFSYYWIADRQGRSLKRLNELFAMNGQVGFLASQRVDGKLILPEAVKTLTIKGTATTKA